MPKKKKISKKKTASKPERLHVKKSQVPRVRQELLDADYLDKLSPSELAWHNKFINEYVNASVKKNKKTRRVEKGQLHKTKALAKACYDANNHRNNDLFGVTKANGLLSYDLPTLVKDNDGWYVSNPSSTEEAMVEYLDNKDKLESTED